VIDRASDSFVQKQFVSQGDYKGRTLTVQVTNNGNVGEVPGLTLNLNWHNEASGVTDLTAFSVVSKATSVFAIEYPVHMMTPGKVYASIQIIQDGKVTNLKEFELTVQKLAGQPVGIVEKAEFSALVAVLADSNRYRTDIDSLSITKADKTALTQVNTNLLSGLSQKVDKGGNEQITLGMLAQEVKTAMTGGSVPVVGSNAVNTSNIVDGAATNAKLASSYAFSGQVISGSSVNAVRKQGVYLVQNGATDVPSTIRAITHLINENVNDRWFLQTLVYYNTSNTITKIWMRRFDINNPPIPEWTTIFDGDIKYRSNVQAISAKDANVIDTDGDYFVSTTTNQPEGALAAGFLRDYSPNANFKLQEYFDRGGNFYFRFLDLLSKPEIKDTVFKRVLTTDDIKQVSLDKPLAGDTIVQFGDSILGNKAEPNDISTIVKQITGATVYNCGFGGCRMAYGKYPRPWEAFSMIGLAEAIVSGDWSAQDTAIADTSQGYPSYFGSRLDSIKTIDFTKVDYITIRYGTNDWNADVFLDNTDDKYDTQTYGGSLRRSLEIILEKYPQIRILVQTPGYRFYLDGNEDFLEDSDTKTNTHNLLLTQYVELCKSISRDYKLVCQDDYYQLGFNKFNRKAFFDGVDGTHPNNVGTRILGEKTAYSLINLV
jgi:lysophospholipase L1-like esterase